MKRHTIVLVLGICFALAARAEVKLARVFSDHMVLQRDMAVPVFGTAEAGQKVTVVFRQQKHAAVADAEGRWRVALDPLKAGGPDTLTVSGSNTVEIQDVLVGEVWVGSGQSNMAGGAGRYAKGDETLAKWIADGPYERIRLLRSKGPGAWEVATPESIGPFSALLFSFGRELHVALDVPVGLMVGAVGGTPSGRWIPPEAFFASEECERLYNEGVVADPYEKRVKRYEAKLAMWEKAAAKAKEAGRKPPRKPGRPAPPPPFKELKPGGLFDAHIRRFVGYGIRGVLWDQGESGTMFPEIDQYTMLGALIAGWRDLWGQGAFPWIYVQKPSGGGCAWDGGSSPTTRKANRFVALPAQINPKDNGLYRELHTRIMRHPDTAMAIARDLGSGVHPSNKSGYGTRAARVARGMVYAQDVVYCGPLYDSHTVEGATVRVRFTHTGKGLATPDDAKLQGFSIAGSDKVFRWGEAAIDGDTVVVSCPDVASPVAVRYAWARSAPWANLFNRDGLPALAFRTDKW